MDLEGATPVFPGLRERNSDVWIKNKPMCLYGVKRDLKVKGPGGQDEKDLTKYRELLTLDHHFITQLITLGSQDISTPVEAQQHVNNLSCNAR